MADVSKTVEIIFAGNDKVSGVIGDIGTSMQAFEGMASPFAKLADGVLAVDKALAAMAVGGIAYASYEAMGFEEKTVNLTKILSDTAKEQVPEVQEKMLALSNTYGFAAVEAMESATNFKKAGFDLQESAVLAEQSAKLVLAAAEAELDAAAATEIMISALKGFGAEASESVRLTDILNKTSNDYATSVTELGIGMSKNAAIFGMMGFSMEESAAALTPVIEVFRSGNEAATSFKSTLLRLTSENKKVAKGFDLLGISQRDANGEMKTGKQLYQDVQEAFVKADQATQNLSLQLLAGKNHAAKMAVAFKSLGYEASITENLMKNAGGSIENEVAAKLNTATAAVGQLAQGFRNIFLLLGNEFLQATDAADGSIVGLIRSITAVEMATQGMISSGAFKEFTDEIQYFAKQAEDFLSGMAEALPEAWAQVDVDGLLEAVRDLFGTFGDFGTELDLTEVDDLAEGLQWLIDTMESLARLTEGIATQFQPLWDTFKEGIAQINDLDTAAQVSFGQLLGSAKLVVDAGAHIAAAFFVIQQSGTEIENVFNIVVGSITAIWNFFQVEFDSLSLYMLEGVQKIVDAVGGVVDFIPGMDDFAKSLAETSKSIQDMQEAIDLHQIEQMEEVVGGAEQAWRGLTGETRDAGKAIDETGESMRNIEDISIGVDNDALNEGLSAAEIMALDAAAEINEEMTPAEIKAVVDRESIENAVQETGEAIGENTAGIPLGVKTDLLSEEMRKAGILVQEKTKEIAEVTKIPLETEVDDESMKKAERDFEMLTVTLEDGSTVEIMVEPNKESIEKAKDKIKKEVPAEKLLEIQTKLEIEQLKADAGIIETKIKETAGIMKENIEWKAKLDIAEVEANATKVVAAFDTIGRNLESTGALMGELFGLLSGELDSSSKWAIMDQIEAENKIRQTQLELQIQLTEAEVAYMNAKTEAMDRGDSLITIDGAGLQPHLESFMFEILKAVQVKANAEGAEFLLGIL